jgi:Domain of Unknown Function (DUF1080)
MWPGFFVGQLLESPLIGIISIPITLHDARNSVFVPPIVGTSELQLLILFFLGSVLMLQRKFVIGFAMLFMFVTNLQGQDKEQTFTDPEKAGKDFAYQGEFSGLIQADGKNWGGQVIALGNGQFRAIGYPGGLPGDGYTVGEATKSTDAKLDGDVVRGEGDEYRLEITPKELRVLEKNGTVLGTLRKVQRESTTLGAKPPKDAIVLFDGTSADAFEGGKLVDGKYLAADCQSKEKFGDHKLHIEFCSPFKPHARGQDRGNSGVYVQGRYEVQVLDSFGLSGENNECGGIYSIAKPKVNMCYPPLSWQTYDIDFTAARYNDKGEKVMPARATIRHNGVVIHENLELKNGTPGKDPEANSDGVLYLQGHGNPVVYRNIWVVKK